MKVKKTVEDRKGIIGFSSAGAHLGVSTYRTPYDAYLEFIGERPEPTPEEQKRFEFGHKAEDFVAALIKDEYGIRVRKSNFAYMNPKYPHLMCHPDRLVADKVMGESVAIEIKTNTAFDRRWGSPDTDEVPMDYLVQCLGYFICTVPCDVVWLFRFSNNTLTRYIIRPDEKLMKEIAAKLESIALRIESGWHPDPVTYEEAARLVIPVEGAVEADEDSRKRFQRLQEIREESKALEAEEDSIKKELVLFMDGRTTLTIGGEKVASYTTVTRSSFDSKAFAEDHPELYPEYLKTTTYQQFR